MSNTVILLILILILKDLRTVKTSNTLIVVILDESDSMSSKKGEVLDGFNDFIAEQKQVVDDRARLYFVKFNTVVTVVHNGIQLESVPQLTADNYTPGGYTALYDAIAQGVRVAERDKTDDERVICVIMTDGEENSSRETTQQQVRDIITDCEARGDWTFLYIGENPERWAKETGMSFDNTLSYDHNQPRVLMHQFSSGIKVMRGSVDRQSAHMFRQVIEAPEEDREEL